MYRCGRCGELGHNKRTCNHRNRASGRQQHASTTADDHAFIHRVMQETFVKVGSGLYCHEVDIKWNHRRRRVIAQATGNYAITFSSFFWNHMTPEQKKETITHEACHLAVHDMGRGSTEGPHGFTWKLFMRKCGYKPSRRMRISTPLPPRFKHKFYCKCREHMLTDRNVRNIANGAVYYCRQCKADIKRTPY